MTLVDLILLALFGAICYGFGRVSMMFTILRTVTETVDETDKPVDTTIELLNIEKHNDMYYAYVGQRFAGQSTTLPDLIANMKNTQKITTFKVAHIPVLNDSERAALAEAIYNNYQIK
jgi:hypothetical protein